MVWPFKKEDKKIKDSKELLPNFEEITAEIKKIQNQSKKLSPREEHSFFSNLLDEIKKETLDIDSSLNLYNKGFLKQNMLENMKKYWDEKKENYIFNFSDTDLRKKLISKIEHLKNLEKDWQELHLTMMEKEENIRKEEKEMKIILKEFKELCNHHIEKRKETKRFKNVSHEHSLVLRSGEIIKNLHDLYLSLISMDEITFSKHVGKHKNDFAKWIRNSLSDHELASRLEMAKNKAEMLEILK